MGISLDDVTDDTDDKPDRLLYYATHGIGKTSFGAGAPDPIFLQTENGLGKLRPKKFPIIFKQFSDVMEAIGELYSKPHPYRSLIVDSLDWLEPIVWAEVCKSNGWNSIDEPGYGRGYSAATDAWRNIIEGLNALRDERNMTIILLAHSEIRKIEPPDSDSYDRYQPKLHKAASALFQENSDTILFGNYRVSLVKEDPKDKNSRQRGVGGGQRVVYTTQRPSHLAKNRWNMPDVIALPDNPDPRGLWRSVAQHIPYYNLTETNETNEPEQVAA